ncbi:MAG: glycosyltransferase [Thermoguttaceae bacterium]|nr:glycosyltransferase [Thermoguttaceae bacterium]
MKARTIGKWSVLRGARSLGVNGCVRRALGHRLLVLCYHGVVPDELPHHRLRTRNAIKAADFRRQMEAVARLFTPVSAGDVLDHVEGRRPLPPRAVLVTFDDGFRNNLTHAAPVLERLGIPAIVHLTVGHIGGRELLWTQELDERVAGWHGERFPMPGGTPDAPLPADEAGRWRLTDRIRAACKQLSNQERLAYLERLRREELAVEEHWRRELYSFLSWDEARELHRRGFALGSHTVTHPILTTLSAGALADELRQSRLRVEQELSQPCPWLAYPNGGHADVSPEVVRAVAEAGYQVAFTLTGGINRRQLRPLEVDRICIPSDASPDAFDARLNGVLALSSHAGSLRTRRLTSAGRSSAQVPAPSCLREPSASQLHVLHVTPGLLLGGMELTMARVIAGLSGRGIRHTVAALREEPQMAERLPPDVPVHMMHSPPNELRLPLRLARLIRQVRPDVIHARNWGAWPDTVAASLLVRPRVPVVLSFHGLGRAGFMPWRRRAASFLLARMVRALVTVSEESKRLMVARWGWPAAKTRVIPNGVDTERFTPAERPVREGPLVVGTVGNLRPVKNQAMLVSACGRLAAAGRDVELRIAGEGPERDALVEQARAEGMADRLHLPGRIDDVPEFLRQLDVFALTSDSEQHPNALSEAMACGLPCVATDVGCVDELLDGGRCGRIVAPRDTAALAAALGELAADLTLRQTLGSLAREHACRHYSLEVMLGAYEKLYWELGDRSWEIGAGR